MSDALLVIVCSAHWMRLQVKPIAKKQLQEWGINYFDLYLVHYPVSLQYVDSAHRKPSGWYGDDGKVYLGESQVKSIIGIRRTLMGYRKYANARNVACYGGVS